MKTMTGRVACGTLNVTVCGPPIVVELTVGRSLDGAGKTGALAEVDGVAGAVTMVEGAAGVAALVVGTAGAPNDGAAGALGRTRTDERAAAS